MRLAFHYVRVLVVMLMTLSVRGAVVSRRSLVP
jgi:hypothetical protein